MTQAQTRSSGSWYEYSVRATPDETGASLGSQHRVAVTTLGNPTPHLTAGFGLPNWVCAVLQLQHLMQGVWPACTFVVFVIYDRNAAICRPLFTNYAPHGPLLTVPPFFFSGQARFPGAHPSRTRCNISDLARSEGKPPWTKERWNAADTPPQRWAL